MSERTWENIREINKSQDWAPIREDQNDKKKTSFDILPKSDNSRQTLAVKLETKREREREREREIERERERALTTEHQISTYVVMTGQTFIQFYVETCFVVFFSRCFKLISRFFFLSLIWVGGSCEYRGVTYNLQRKETLIWLH